VDDYDEPKTSLLEKLLTDHVCSDVVFELSDGERVFAHKCVLAAASEPLKALVTGPWLENQNDNGVCVVKVVNSAAAIKAMLTFVYSSQNELVLQRFDYIKSKGPSITMASSFVEMKSSHPEVWKSLRKDLGVPDHVV